MRHILVKKKSWFRSPFVAVALVIFVIWGSFSVVRAGLKQNEAVRLRDGARKEFLELEQKQSVLHQKIQNLSTDAGLESEIRQRYRVVKPGEQLVIVVNNDKPEDAPKSPEVSFWHNLRMFVGL